MQNFIDQLNTFFNSGLGTIVKALLLLILAFIVANIVKNAIVKLLNKGKIKDVISRADGDSAPGTTANYIAKLVYLLVFLLFVPGIFGALGADSVATPVLGMLNTIWNYVPNIIGAIIVLVIGFFVARLVRQLLIPVFDKLKVDKLQEKAGLTVRDSAKLSHTLAYIVYVLILIPIIIIALQILNIKAISEPAVGMLNTIIAFIPNVIVAAIIIGIGVLIGKFGGQIISRLIGATGADEKVRDLTGTKSNSFVLSKVVGGIVTALIVIFFTVEGINVLHLDVLTNIGTKIISYLPQILAAAIILAITLFLANIATKAMNNNGLGAYSFFAKIAIIAIGCFMILNQLRIATSIVNSAFIIILAAVAVAFAIAFGIGGRDFAKKTLDKVSDKIDTAVSDADASIKEDRE